MRTALNSVSATATMSQMKQSRRLTLGRTLVLTAATVLLADTFLPWQRLSQGQFSYSWNAWHGDKGVLLGALTSVLIAWVAARGLGFRLPARAPEASTTLALAVLVFALAAVKNVRDDYSAWGSYLGVVLAAAVVAAAWGTHRRGVAESPPAASGSSLTSEVA
jgi:hypothetical protein